MQVKIVWVNQTTLYVVLSAYLISTDILRILVDSIALELLKDNPEIVRYTKCNKEDQIYVEWFEQNYELRDFFHKREDYINLIIDKLDG